MYNKVEICGVNTAKLKTLTGEEKQILLKRAKEGDEKAREELICGNLRLVLSVIQKFTLRGENPDDLFQVGCVGLIKAVDNFDINQNVLFSTYAVPMNVLCRKAFPKNREGFLSLKINEKIRVIEINEDCRYKEKQNQKGYRLICNLHFLRA